MYNRIMARKKNEEIESTNVATDVNEISVYNNDVLVRTYSREIHGDNFAECAKELADKKGLVVK